MKILVLFIFLNSYFCKTFHPLHVSVTSIDFVEDKGEFKVSIKLFKDDFEKIVNNKYQVNLDIFNCNIQNADSIFIEKYILEHFSMKFDGKNILKKELHCTSICNEEAIWVSFKFKTAKPKRTIVIKNSLMNDLYNDQKNLVIFKMKDIEKGIQFNNKTTIAEFDL